MFRVNWTVPIIWFHSLPDIRFLALDLTRPNKQQIPRYKPAKHMHVHMHATTHAYWRLKAGVFFTPEPSLLGLWCQHIAKFNEQIFTAANRQNICCGFIRRGHLKSSEESKFLKETFSGCCTAHFCPRRSNQLTPVSCLFSVVIKLCSEAKNRVFQEKFGQYQRNIKKIKGTDF